MNSRTGRWCGLMVLALLGAACERDPEVRPDEKAPDNTAKNARDLDGTRPTPAEQGENEADRGITAEIRRQLVAGESLSLNARNCKIITRDGAVTLRGPVQSQSEKELIESVARSVAGVQSVTNELEVLE